MLSNKNDLKNWTIPKWEDFTLWKNHWNKENNKTISTGWVGSVKHIKINSPEELRNTCYKFLTETVKKNSDHCKASEGWCDTEQEY